jgi:hypothetical protein
MSPAQWGIVLSCSISENRADEKRDVDSIIRFTCHRSGRQNVNDLL